MRLPRPSLVAAALAAATAFSTACNEERRQTAAREVSEEAAPIVEAIGPESDRTVVPPPPPALISIRETLSAISAGGGLTELGAAAAVPVIDKWIGTLDGNLLVDDTDLIVEDLRLLRAALSGASAPGDEVEDILERLARETRQAGEDADDEAVVELAEWLEKGAEALD